MTGRERVATALERCETPVAFVAACDMPELEPATIAHLLEVAAQAPGADVERDVPFWTIPDSDRQLLCDIWRPAEGTASGLAYVYLHPSGWAVGDKAMFTRPFFNHLTAQGHTVVDVAYRLLPEVDLRGMVGDAKRAVAWGGARARARVRSSFMSTGAFELPRRPSNRPRGGPGARQNDASKVYGASVV